MASESNKKLLLFYVLDILREYSDENHPIMQNEIAEKIRYMYGLDTCNRKTVSANIEALKELNYDIYSMKNKGYYLGARELEPSQITYLIDAVFSSKILTSKQSQEISKKLSNFLSKYQRKQYNYIYKSDEISRIDKTQLFYTIDVINESIEQNKKICFDYIQTQFDDNTNTSTVKRIVNPYFMVNNQGKYYLVCGYGEKYSLANYRIEKIINVTILNETILPIKKVKGFENGFDIAKYVNENIYMFGGESINAKIHIENDYGIGCVQDWFDKNIKFYKKDGEIFVDVTANEMALIYWCLQYGEHVQLISPETTKEKIKLLIDNLKRKYN